MPYPGTRGTIGGGVVGDQHVDGDVGQRPGDGGRQVRFRHAAPQGEQHPGQAVVVELGRLVARTRTIERREENGEAIRWGEFTRVP